MNSLISLTQFRIYVMIQALYKYVYFSKPSCLCGNACNSYPSHWVIKTASQSLFLLFIITGRQKAVGYMI